MSPIQRSEIYKVHDESLERVVIETVDVSKSGARGLSSDGLIKETVEHAIEVQNITQPGRYLIIIVYGTFGITARMVDIVPPVKLQVRVLDAWQS